MKQITPPSSWEDLRASLLDLVVSRKTLSETYHQSVLLKQARLYNLYRGLLTGRFHPHKNNVSLPLLYALVWSDVARKIALSFGSTPFVSFQGYGPNDSPIVRRREALIQAQFMDARIVEKEVLTMLTAGLYGTAVSFTGWDFRERLAWVPVDQRDALGNVMHLGVQRKITEFDGPNHWNIDRLDAFPQPGYRLPRDMDWMGHREVVDYDVIREQTELGMVGFDPQEVQRLGQEGGPLPTDQFVGMSRSPAMGMQGSTQPLDLDNYGRPVELLHFFGRVPRELAIDGDPIRCLTVANRQFLLRNVPHPFWHKQMPYVTFAATLDPHFFDAPGKGEVSEKLQLIANRHKNQILDAMDLIIDPAYWVSRRANMTENLYMKPGGFYKIDGIPSEMVQPMHKDVSGVMAGQQSIADAWEYMQIGTGLLDDVIMGQAGSSRQTAREFVGRRGAAETRLALESRIYEATYLEPLAQMYVANNKQFLPTPKMVTILGESAMMDPVTGMPILPGHEVMQATDLVADYSARAQGSATALNKGIQQQNMATLAQYIGASPLWMMFVNAPVFLRNLFRTFDQQNINELTTPPLLQQKMVAMQALGVSGSESGGNGASASSKGSPDTSASKGNGKGSLPPELAALMGSGNTV